MGATSLKEILESVPGLHVSRSPVVLDPDVGDYSLTDLILKYMNPNGHWEVSLGVKNVFDEDAREPAPTTFPEDYPLAGRSFFVETRLRF